MDIQEKIDVLVACRDGKTIEIHVPGSGWLSVSGPKFNFSDNDYRVKKEPEIVYEVETSNYYHLIIKKDKLKEDDIIIKKFIEVMDE